MEILMHSESFSRAQRIVSHVARDGKKEACLQKHFLLTDAFSNT